MSDKSGRFRGSSFLTNTKSQKNAAALPRNAGNAAPVMEMLEPRVLYSADLLPALFDPHELAIDGAADDNFLSAPATVSTPVELVLINGDLQDIDTLLVDFNAQQMQGRELRIHILDTQDAGIGQVESLLGRYENISQVHILSHGNQNGLQLGGSWLDHESAGNSQFQFAQWKQHLPEDASLLFYGCDLAASASGVSFLNSLSNLTGVQVFASDDDTGHISLKADWELEYHTGDGFYESLLSEVARANWNGELPAGFTANDDNIGAVVSGNNLNFDSDTLTSNDVYSGSQPPVILSNTLPALGSLVASGTDYTFSTTAGDSGVASFDYRAMDGSPDLISQWRLTTDGSDDADRNNGAVTSNTAAGTLVFDGDDYVEIPGFSYPSEFTLTFDFRVNDLDNDNEEALFSQGEWQTANYLGIWINGRDEPPGRRLITEINDSTESGSGGSFAFDVSGFEDDGLWHNYAIVVTEGVGHSVYIDGNLEHSAPWADDAFTPTGPAYFGAEKKGAGHDYHLINHEINNARLYNGFDLATIQANELNEFSSGTASITVRNEEVLTTLNTIEVTEDQSVPITSASLFSTDIEDGPAALTYAIATDASYGKLVVNGTDLNNDDTFTQKDINDGNVAFRHTGNETQTADSMFLYVDDGAGTRTGFVLSIDINLQNDAPAMGDATLASIEEDAANPPGELVGSIFDAVFTDDDGTLGGIAITADPASMEGMWQYSSDAGASWYNVGSVSTSFALMVERTSMLRFLPAAEFYRAVPQLTVHAVDDSYVGDYTDGNIRETADLTSRGGNSPYADVVSMLGSGVNPVGPVDLSGGITLNTGGGNDSYLLATDGGALLGGLSEFTVEAQFELDSVNTSNALFSYNTSAGDMLKVMVRSDGSIRVGLLDVDFTTTPVPELLNGERHSVAASWDSDGGYLRVFADGRFVGSEKALHVGQSVPAGGTLIMGLEQDSGTGFETIEVFSGTLYDVRVWDEARTPAEINKYHNEKLFVEELPASLIANWQMDGVNGLGNVIDVVSGNNLTVEHATGAGFTSNTPVTRLQVAEDATPGTIVGSLQGSYPSRVEDIVKDGSFTQAGATYKTMYPITAVIGEPGGHWEVISGDVELVPAWDESPDGGVLIDLTGTTPGSISQSIATVPGKTYQVNFALSGDFNSTDSHTLQVAVDSGAFLTVDSFTVNKPNYWATDNLLWDHRSLTFVADTSSATLSLSSLTESSAGGPLISDVTVMEIDPAIAAVLAANPSVTYNNQTHKFYLTDPTITDWITAQDNAVARELNGVSGRQVTIHSDYENSVVRAMADTMGTDVYLGASDQTTEGQWYWQSDTGNNELLWFGNAGGTPSNGVYTNWKSGEPNEHGSGEDHAVMFRTQGNGVWSDAKLTDLWYASIVEWEADEVLSRVSYSITSDPENAFTIDPSTGEISVADLTGIDYETDPIYDITVRVSDVAGEFYDESVTIFISDNSAPQITGIESEVLDYTENDVPVTISSTLVLSDADDLNLQSATVYTSTLPSQGVLHFADYGPFTSNWNPATGELTITGDATVVAWQNALRTVTYENISDNPTPGQISVNFEVSDGSESSNIVSRSLNITPVNDAPALADSTLADVQENNTNPAGETINDVFLGQFSDVDGSMAGVAVVHDASTVEGDWQYFTVAGAGWVPVGPVSAASALVLDPGTRLRFVPAPDYYGSVPELDVIGIDDSYTGLFTGASAVYEDVSIRGSDTAFAADEAALSSVVTAVGPTDLSSGIELNKDGGNDAYLFASNAAGLVGGLDALTVEVLATVDQTDQYTTLLSYSTSADSNTLLFAINNDGALFLFVNGSAAYSPAGTFPLPHDAQPHAMAFSWDSLNGDVAFYIDGVHVFQKQGVATGELISAGGTLVIGQEQDSNNGSFDPTQRFEGTYHDLRIWNEVRSEAEIAHIHEHKLHPDSLPSSLIANWQMDEIDGNGDVVDVVSGATLSVSHATGAGFTSSNPAIGFSVQEYSANGTAVGALVPHANVVVDDIVSDGSFTHAGATGYELYFTGQTIGAGGPWLVDSGDVNLQGSWDSTPLGGVALDLSGTAPGSISQTLSTEVGETYQVNFVLTGNFDGPSDKSMTVTAAGLSENFIVSQPDGWNFTNALMWNHRSFTFSATSDNTPLTFTANAPNDRYGPVIGDVQVVKLPDSVADLLAGDPDLQYDAGTGKFYKAVSTLANFPDARDDAVATELNGISGQLVTIGSAYENAVVHNLAQSLGTAIWLGASDSDSEGHWHWLDGDQQGTQFWDGEASGSRVDGAYTNWSSGEPNNSNAGEDYLALRRDNTSWNDVGFTTTYPYVVEWDAGTVLSGYTFSITSDPSGAFAIDGASGVITVADTSLIDYEIKSSHDLVVRVTDASGERYDEKVTIAITDALSPVLSDTATGTLVYYENGAPLVVAPSIEVSDADDTQLQYATVTITGDYQPGEDILLFPNTSTLTGVWNSSFGVLTITGSDSIAALQDALRTVAYQNTSDNPTAGSRGIAYLVYDANESSNTLAKFSSVVAVNDAPVIANVSINDTAEDSISHAGQTIADIFSGAFTDADGGMFGIAVTTDATTGEGAWQFSTNNGGTWHATGSVSEVNALVLGTNTHLRFLPAVNYNGVVPELTVYAIDDSFISAVPAGAVRVLTDVTVRGGATAISADSAAISGNVTAINDAPDITDGYLNDVTEDTTSPAGDLISNIFSGVLTDVDGDVLGISVANDATSTEGDWQYLTAGDTNWYSVGPVSETTALVLDVDTRLRFVPAMNFHGTVPELRVYGADNSNGGIGTIGSLRVLADVTARGGTTPFSAAAATINSTVLAVNDSPLTADSTMNVIEDIPYTVTLSDFVFSDPHDGNAFSAVQIVDAPAVGELLLSGAMAFDGDLITTNDIAAGRLEYRSQNDANGAAYDTFTYRVQDDGGTAHGGNDTSVLALHTVDVTGTNDAPSLTTGMISLLRGGIHTIDSTNIEAVDVDVDESQRVISVTATPVLGALHLRGTPLNIGDTFSQADVNVGDLRYVNNGISSLDDAFALSFADAGDNASTPPVNQVVNISVTETHPVGVADSASVDEHQSVVISVLDNDTAADQAIDPSTVEVVVQPDHGTTTVYANGEIEYKHDGSETASDTFTYRVRDVGGDVSDPVTVSLSIDPVNDIPILGSFVGPATQILEDTTVEITAAELASQIVHSDAEDGTLNRFRITGLTSGVLFIGADPATASEFIPGSNDIISNTSHAYWTPENNDNGLLTAFSVQGLDRDNALSVDSLFVDIEVLPVNDVPVTGDGDAVLAADETYTFTTTDFIFTDPVESDSFQAVRIDSLPVDGQLLLWESPVNIGDELAVADIDAGELRFVPHPAPDTVTRTFDFRVRDGGGTDNSGLDLSAAARFTLTITPGEIPDASVDDDPLPFQVSENTAVGTVVGDLSELKPEAIFVHQRGGDFAGASQSQPGFNRYAADGSELGATLDQWQVDSGTVDLRGPAWATGPGGGFALDMNGAGPGQISQQIVTVPGAQYVIKFNLSGNFLEVPADGKVSVEVSAAGDQGEFEFEYFPQWSKTDLQWREQSMMFTATGSSTSVSFASSMSGVYGALIADIEVIDVLNFQLVDNTLPFDVLGNSLVVAGSLDHESIDNYPLHVIATNSVFDSVIVDVPVNVLDTNESPTLIVNQTLAMIAGQTVVIDTDHLSASDVDIQDSPGSSVTYTLTSLPANGVMRLNTIELGLGDSFSQADLEQATLTYQHSGLAASTDGFEFLLDDGGEDGAVGTSAAFDIDIHNPLSVSVTTDWSLLEGGTVTLSDQHISRTDGLIDNSELRIDVVALSENFSVQSVVDSTRLNSFSMHDVVSGNVTLVHDGSNRHGGDLQLQFTRLDDGTSPLDPQLISLTALDVADAPFGSNSSLATDHLTPLTITTQQLGFNDSDDGDGLAGIEIIEPPASGVLQVAGVAVLAGDIVGVDKIDNGQLFYVPNPATVGVLSESVTFRIIDDGDEGNGGNNRSAGVYAIEFTVRSDHPPQAQSDYLVVDEGETVASLSGGAVSVTENDIDLDTAATDLVVDLVAAPLNGVLQLNADGTFSYSHDGGESRSDGFSYRVVDSTDELNGQAGSIGMVEIEISPRNDAPTAGEVPDEQVIASQQLRIELPVELFTDVDIDDNLTLAATLANGSALPQWLSFEPATGEFSGTPGDRAIGSLEVIVTATDSAGESAQSQLTITVEPQFDAAFAAVPEVSPEPEAASNTLPEVSEQAGPIVNIDPVGGLVSAPDAKDNRTSVAPDDEAIAYAITDNTDGTIDLTFEDLVVKHERQRSVTTHMEQLLVTTLPTSDAVVELQQLFFTAGDGASKMAKSMQKDLNQVRDELSTGVQKEKLVVGGAISLSAGFSIGYVIFLIRGGLLLTSVLASMPAWRVIDPVPVLAEMSDDENEEDAESLQSIVNENNVPEKSPEHQKSSEKRIEGDTDQSE